MHDITIFYRKSSDFKMLPISGVWGGLTAQGYVYCELFLEKAETPESITLSIGDDNIAKEVGKRPETNMFIRETLVGLTMQPDIARSVGQWLIGKADEFQKKFMGKEK